MIVLAVTAVIALTTSGVALWRSDDGPGPAPTGPTATVPAPSASTPSPTTPEPTMTTSVPTSPSGTATTSSSAFRFVPLWPFGSVADAVAWQRDAGAGGHQPWRLDAGSTAVAFAHDHLGYTEIDRVTSTQVVSGVADQVWVGVGYALPEGGRDATAAVLHLERIGSGALSTRPWEVVGSRDSGLTLTAPRYGATVASRFTVGGRITGVDESLVVQVVGLRGTLYTAAQGLPAGGERTPWSTTVTLTHPRSGIATVAVATGGHLMAVERFAVTAVRVSVPVDFAAPEAALRSVVGQGTYLGDCAAVGSVAGVTDPVCSTFVKRAGDRYLYRVGYWRTDVGFFVALGRTGAGRWVVLDPYLETAG